MTFLELLDELARRGVAIDVDPDGRLITDAPRGALDDDLAAQVRIHRDLVVWTVVGRRTGHRWLSCDTCNSAQMVRPERNGKPCAMTARCKGHLRSTSDRRKTA